MEATKEVKFDRKAREWSAYLDGQYIGSFSNPSDANQALDRMVFDFQSRH
jgi:hypothetical protein